MWGDGGGRGSTTVRDLPPSHLLGASFDILPTALCPLPEVCGGDDQIQRGSSGLS